MIDEVKILTDVNHAFKKFADNYEPLKLAIIETLHRFIFDKSFSKGDGGRLLKDDATKHYFELYQELHCQYPDWRYRLKKHFGRYQAWESTNALHTSCKPKTNEIKRSGQK